MTNSCVNITPYISDSPPKPWFSITSVVNIGDMIYASATDFDAINPDGYVLKYNTTSDPTTKTESFSVGGPVGDMVVANDTVYTPIIKSGATATIARIKDDAVISPIQAQLEESNDFFRTLVVDNGIMYGATNNGYIYSSSVINMSNTSWNKISITKLPGSLTGEIPDVITVYKGTIYIGTHFEESPEYGNLYMLNSSGEYKVPSGYTAYNHAVTALISVKNNLYVGLKKGGIWTTHNQ